MQEILQGLTGWQYVAASAALTIISVAGLWAKNKIGGRKQATARTFEGMAQIYDILNEVALHTDCDRALILYTSNGGGIPSTQTVVYTTCLYEHVHGHGLLPIRPFFQQIPVDVGYVRLLNEVISQGHYHAHVRDMAPGFLTDMLMLEGTQEIRLCEILRTPERYYFLALRWRKPPASIAAVDVASHMAVANLRQLLSG